MVINDLNIMCTVIPCKTHSPLHVYSYAVLPYPVTWQWFKPITGQSL